MGYCLGLSPEWKYNHSLIFYVQNHTQIKISVKFKMASRSDDNSIKETFNPSVLYLLLLLNYIVLKAVIQDQSVREMCCKTLCLLLTILCLQNV